MKQEHIYEIIGIFVFALTLLVFLSFISYNPADLPFYTSHPNVPAKNLVNIFGAYVSGISFFLFGWASYLLPFFLFLWGLKFVRGEKIRANIVKIFGLFVMAVALSSFLTLFFVVEPTFRFRRGGIVGLVFADFLTNYFGRAGAYVIVLMLGLLSLPLIGEILVLPFFARFIDNLKSRLPVLDLPGLLARFRKKEKRPVSEPRPRAVL